MKNRGTEYLQELRNKVGELPESTIFAEIEGRDEQYIRLSHAEHASRLAYDGAFKEQETDKTRLSILQYITSPSISNVSIKSCIAYAKTKDEAILNLQALRNNVIQSLDALNRMDKHSEINLID